MINKLAGFSISILLSFLILLLPNIVFANQEINNVVLFVNQVRGEECCQKGNLKNLTNQISAFNKNNLKATFVIRYDALVDPQYQTIFHSLNQDTFELGAFLEITPELAKESGVKYSGDETNWSQAQIAYTVGYSLEDRIKILDTYMVKFYEVFGYYPQITTAWIMDTYSLNYLNDTYRVKAHQITREQWGTDSYTMSGGPVHYPYFASRNWAFMPSNNPTDNNLLMLRQTGSDPLYNYGDTTNAFTTQPNDYQIDNKNIEYFSLLINQFMSQTTNEYNFVLLGLESSMYDEVQEEFINQINLIGKNKKLSTLKVSDFYDQYSTIISNNKNTSLRGGDLINNSNIETFWINTRNYRVRLIKTNNKIKITDIRLYNNDIQDPYNSIIAKKHGYWITPFIFDGSRFYYQEESISNDYRSKLRKKYLPEFQFKNLELKASQKDFISIPDGITFNIKDKSSVLFNENDENIVLEFLSDTDQKNKIIFNNNSFSTPLITDESVKSDFSNFLSINNKKISFGESYDLLLNCDIVCNFKFSQPNNNQYKELIKEQYTLFFPEINSRGIDNDNSIFYAHNKYAVYGKNPIRFVFIPKDSVSYSTLPDGTPNVTTQPLVKETILHSPEGNGTTFFDVNAQEIGKYMVTFSVEDFEQTHEVYLAPNCKVQQLYCILHPRHSIWYLKSMFYTKLRNF
jgi:hypothetical protein